MTKFYELYPRCSSGQEWFWFMPCLCLLKRNWPASLKLAKAQNPSHNTGMRACVLMPVLALFHMCLHSIQTHAGGVAVVSWHFPRGLHSITENVSYVHAHPCKCIAYASQLMSVFWICKALKWLSQVVWPLIAPDEVGGEVDPVGLQKKTHSSYTHLENDVVFDKHRGNQCMWRAKGGNASGHGQTSHS